MSYWVILRRCVHGNLSTSSIFYQGWEIIQWSNLVRSWLLDSLKSWLTVGYPISSQLHLQISKLTTSFSQNPNLKWFILCSNFLFIFYFFLHAGSTPHKRKVDSTFHSLASWSSHSSKRSPTFPKNRLNISPKQNLLWSCSYLEFKLRRMQFEGELCRNVKNI